MTTTPAAPAPTAATVTLPASDVEVQATLGLDVTDLLEARWHAGACGCFLIDDQCTQFGQGWRDYAPVTWMVDAVLVALRDVVTARDGIPQGRAAA